MRGYGAGGRPGQMTKQPMGRALQIEDSIAFGAGGALARAQAAQAAGVAPLLALATAALQRTGLAALALAKASAKVPSPRISRLTSSQQSCLRGRTAGLATS